MKHFVNKCNYNVKSTVIKESQYSRYFYVESLHGTNMHTFAKETHILEVYMLILYVVIIWLI